MNKLEEIVKALAALTKAVPGCHSVTTYYGEFVRLSVNTDRDLASLSAVLGATIETVDHCGREWEVGLANVGEIRVEVSGPHRDKRTLPEPKPVEIDDAALATAHAVLESSS